MNQTLIDEYDREVVCHCRGERHRFRDNGAFYRTRRASNKAVRLKPTGRTSEKHAAFPKWLKFPLRNVNGVTLESFAIRFLDYGVRSTENRNVRFSISLGPGFGSGKIAATEKRRRVRTSTPPSPNGLRFQ